MFYILHSKDALDPAAASFNGDSIFAWNVEPDLSLAPIEAWQEVADLEVALDAAPGVQEQFDN